MSFSAPDFDLCCLRDLNDKETLHFSVEESEVKKYKFKEPGRPLG